MNDWSLSLAISPVHLGGVRICFVTGWVNVRDRLPLVLASNRDELYDRAGEPPEISGGESSYEFLAPRDPREGGTWLGINERGLIVALTNRPELDKAADPGARSRGLLVRDLLRETESLESVRKWLEDERTEAYPPFTLLAISSEGVFKLRRQEAGGEIEVYRERLCFFLSSRSNLELYSPDERDKFPWGGHGEETKAERMRGRLQNFCRQHEDYREHGQLCRHGEEFGTLSSTILLVDQENRKLHYDFAPGPPCEKTYKSVDVPPDFNRDVVDFWR